MNKTRGRQPDPLRGDDVLEEEGDRSITPAWTEDEEGKRDGGGEGGTEGRRKIKHVPLKIGKP